VVEKQIFPGKSCAKQTQLQQYRLPFAKWKFVGLQSPNFARVVYVLFGMLGNWTKDQLSSVLCLSISDWRARRVAVCHPVYTMPAPVGVNSFGTITQLAELCSPLW